MGVHVTGQSVRSVELKKMKTRSSKYPKVNVFWIDPNRNRMASKLKRGIEASHYSYIRILSVPGRTFLISLCVFIIKYK
jgi:hypothetical protein